MASTVEIRVTALGAEQAAQVLKNVAAAGGQIGSVVEKGAGQAGAALGGLQGNLTTVNQAMSAAGVNTGAFGQILTSLANPAIAAGAAFGALTGVLAAVTSEMTSNATAVRQLMAVSGLGAEEADNLADAFKLIGVESETLSKAMFKMADEIDKGGEGLKKLDVSLKDSQGNLKTEGQLFLDVIDKVQGLGSASERAAAMQDIFGKSARELTVVANMNREAFAALLVEARRYSDWTERQQVLTQDFMISQQRVSLAIGGIAQVIGTSLLPVLTEAQNAFATWLVEFRGSETLADISESIVLLIRALGDLGSALMEMGSSIGAVLSPLEGMLGPTQSISDAVRQAVQLIKELSQVIQVGLNAALTLVAGPIAYFASLLDDLANKRLPDFSRAAKEAAVAQAEAQQRLAQSAEKFQDIVIAGARDAGLAWREGVVNVTGLGNAAQAAGDKVAGVGRQSEAAAREAKKLAEEAKKLAEHLEKGEVATDKFERELQAMLSPTSELDKKLLAIDLRVESLVREFPEFEARIRATGQAMKDNVEAVDKLTKAWEKLKDLPQDLAEDFNKFDVAMLGTTDLTKKVVDGLAGIVKEGDQFRLSLTAGRGVMLTFNEAFEGVIERVQKLPAALKTITPEMENLADETDETAIIFSKLSIQAALLSENVDALVRIDTNITPALNRLTMSAEDAALELALLNDSIEPLLALAEDERWANIGESLEDAFLSITDTFSGVVDGFIQGTLDIENVLEDLGLKILANFNQFALHTIFDPFLKAAASFATDLARALEGGDWQQVGAVVSERLAGTPLGLLFGIESAPSGAEGLMKEGAQFEQMEIFSIKNLLNAQTIIAGIAVLVNSIALMAQGRVATGIGTLIGGIAGGVIGGVAGGGPMGIAVGAGAGSAVGGLIGSFFEEDYAALRRLRTQQRQRTSQAALEDTLQDIRMADDLGELAQQLSKSMAGTLSSQGGVLLSMLQDSRTRQQLAGVSADEAARVERFLTGQGFHTEGFAQGRVGSVAELFAGAPEEWEALLEGLAQFLEILEKTYGTLVPKLEGMSRQDFTKSKALFEALDTAIRLEELGFEDAGGKIRERLRAMIEQFGDAAGVLAEITANAFRQVERDPTQLLRFANVEQWQRAGEDIEDTTERLTASLELVGATMADMADELLRMNPPLYAALINIQDVMTEFADADWQGIYDALQSTDPSEWGAALVEAHDLLMARYEAEIILIQQIIAGIDQLFASANAIVGTAARLQELGILPSGGMELASTLATRGAAAVGSFAFPEMNLVAGRGAVDLFAQQSMMAARSMNLPALEASMAAAGSLIEGFTATIDQINQIQDPSERMRLLTEVLAQTGDAAAAAAEAAITYWQTLHDTVSGMIDQLNGIASNIAATGNALASNADWLTKAGVDVPALANQMLGLIDLFPTMGAKIDLLGSGVKLFIAGMDDLQMERLTDLGKQFEGAQGTPAQAAIGAAIVEQLQPVLAGFVSTFTSAMALQDPGARLAALTTILEQVGGLLGSLPPELANALVTMFGPEIQTLVAAIQQAAAEQAAQAALVAAELKSIIGTKALSPENFLLMTVQGIQDSLNIIILGATPLFEKIVAGMESAGLDISAAIGVAGKALDDALGGFKTPAEQLTKALNDLREQMGTTMYTAVTNAINDALGAETGMPYVPATGIYKLHKGEGVLTAEENELFQRGGLGSFQSGTGSFGSMLRGILTTLANTGTDFKESGKLVADAFRQHWDIAELAFRRLLDSNDDLARMIQSAMGDAAQILSGLGPILGSAWASLPSLMADAVKIGIDQALTDHGLATGTPWVPRTGLYLLHQGEAVIPAERNPIRNLVHAGVESYRASGGTSITLPAIGITLNIGKATKEDAAHIARLVEQTLGRSIRSGKLRRDLRNLQRGIS